MGRSRLKNRYLGILDIALCFAGYFAVFLVVYPFSNTFSRFVGGIETAVITTAIYCVFLVSFRIYNIDWVYAATKEYLRLIGACVGAGTVSVLAELMVPNSSVFPKLNITANIFIIVCICLLRFAVRILYNLFTTGNGTGGKRVLIVGAGQLAMTLLRDIRRNERLNYKIVGLIDDDHAKKNMQMHGAKVLGDRNDIQHICESMNVEEIIFAIYALTPKEKAKILDICSQTGKKVKILHSFESNLKDTNSADRFRDINIEDLLEREPVELDNHLIQKDIFGKVVLVTGAGGSIGSELCRQIIKYNPRRLIILDIYENTTYDLQNELMDEYPNQNVTTLIASVRDKKRLDSIFEEYKPDIVFHAAAHKHVPLMEDSPCEAIKNNVLGTYNAALCAKEFNVKKFVLISTDKAVNPTNVMGASKRMCEMIIQTMQKYSTTDFVAVRFGNVLGSNGSVIPRFKKQIEKGGPVTVTHPEITRFFMTIPEAAQLVLQAAAYAQGGEIFVLDMGQPVKIYDLAKKMIRLSGLKPDEDIEIKFTGLRAGEKLYEELLMDEEGLEETRHSKIFIGKPGDLEMKDIEEKIDRLKSVIDSDGDEVKKIVAEVVPTYEIYKA